MDSTQFSDTTLNGSASQATYLRRIYHRQFFDQPLEIGQKSASWNSIALVEPETLDKHVLVKPNTAEGVEQSLVEIICDTSAILNFAKHVPDSVP